MNAALPKNYKIGATSAWRALWVRGVAAATGAATGAERKTTRLKRLLTSPELSFLMEAHSGLSARIADEAGFAGLWASGLSISAQLGVRDSNEASWTQVLEVAELMADAAAAPVLLDADTGYGNFNNARRLVRKLEQRGVAGCCIEDKCFPKTNSLLDGRQQPLADIDEFALKIQGPVVIVPTKYPNTPTALFRELGVSTVIWANHSLRASVGAMQAVTRRIMAEQSIAAVENEVVSVQEVFRLQRDDELKEAEERFLPKK